MHGQSSAWHTFVKMRMNLMLSVTRMLLMMQMSLLQCQLICHLGTNSPALLLKTRLQMCAGTQLQSMRYYKLIAS